VIAPKDAPMEHPAGERGRTDPGGQADTESVWSAAAPSADREAPAATPAPEASVARPVEAELPEAAAQPVSHGVSLHMAEGETSVDIRMAERGGEIRVTVHTPDHELANSLRVDLPDLVGKLRQSGFQAEAWRPTQSDGGRRAGSDGFSRQEDSAGARKDGRQQQPQQHAKDQSRWAGEWQSSLAPTEEFPT